MLFTKYQGFRHSGYRLEDTLSCPYVRICKTCGAHPGAGAFCSYGHNLNKLRKDPLNDATYQLSRNWVFGLYMF